MTISTATLLGLFALAGVVCVCATWLIVQIINARIRIEQERTEQAYHLRDVERLRVEAARYTVMLNHEQRAVEVRHVTR